MAANALTGHAHMLAPAPACENLYYPSTTGHIFATPNQHARMRLPFLGMVILATGDAPIEIRQEDQLVRADAMMLWGKDMRIRADAGYICISVNPFHPFFRAFALLPAPHVQPLVRSDFDSFNMLIERAMDGCLTHEESLALFDGILTTARPSLPAAPPLDERAQALMKQLWDDPKSSITKLASNLGLSYHRTSHLFSEAVGLPVRKYQLWQKLYRSGGPLSDGATVTEAAQVAGFVDSAHFSRTFHSAYGRSPRTMFRTRRIRVFTQSVFREVTPPS